MFIIISDVVFFVEEIYCGRSVIIGFFICIVLVWWEKLIYDMINRIGEGDGV